MSSPYGPPGGYPHWGQQPPNTGMPQGGAGYPQPGFAPQPPAPQQPPPPQYGYGQQFPPPYQQPGQFPQGQFPQQGGFGAPPQRKKRSALPWVLGGSGLLVVVVVLVLGFVAPGWFVRSVFDASSVEKGVEQTLKSSYGLPGVGSVSCPGGQVVKAGNRFDCQVQIDSEPKTVTITVKTDKGVYEVGHPK